MRILPLLVAAGIATVSAAAPAPAVVAKIKVAPGARHVLRRGRRLVWVSEYGSPYLLRIDPRRTRSSRSAIDFGSCGLGEAQGRCG